MYELKSSIVLTRPLKEVFQFFSDAGNLEILTPAFLRFEILTPVPIELRPGTLIDYRLKIRGIPVKWQSEITVWEPPHRFVDEQRRGPYRCWIHQHLFREEQAGTRVEDHVQYDHLGGFLLNRLLVAPDLQKVFDHRQKKLREIFPDPD